MRCRHMHPMVDAICSLPRGHDGRHQYTAQYVSLLEEELMDARREWARSKGVCKRECLEAAQIMDSSWWPRIKEMLDRTY